MKGSVKANIIIRLAAILIVSFILFTVFLI